MKLTKTLLKCFLFFSFSANAFCLSLQDLITIAFENNSEIISAKATYETGIISAKTVNGYYTPNITLSSSSAIPKDYKWNSEPDSFSSSITYSQALPGGTTLNLVTGYSCSFFDISTEKLISQNPQISLGLSQSLLPFWAQAKIQDPVKLSLEQQKEYYYFQLMYTKKNVLQNLIQNYIYALTAKNEIEIYNTTIKLYEEQVESLQKLKTTGNINESEILEIENSKWNAQQNLISAQAGYIGYIQNLKSICGQCFDEKKIEQLADDNIKTLIQTFITPITNEDPLEKTYKLKSEILKSQRIADRQSSAAILNLSVQPVWNLATEKKDAWNKAWKDFDKPAKWNVTIGLNLTPVISEISKQNEKRYQIEYDATVQAYALYLQQKEFVKQQYETILKQYQQQLNNISILLEAALNELNDYKTQLEDQVISKLDFDSEKVRVENLILSKESIRLYVWMYNLLVQAN